ncbi:MAG: ComEA family DNA-binding protein [Bacteroidota bacterium]|nr:ComEA family DNA-binding protein [Bacteroidota bacterium]
MRSFASWGERLWRALALRPEDALALGLVLIAALAVEGLRWTRRPDPGLAASLVSSDSLFQARWRSWVEAAQARSSASPSQKQLASAGLVQAGFPQNRTAPPARLISVNRASAAQLERLPGIGPKLAAAIVAYREQHGPFRRVEDLLRVRGIGPKKLAQIRDWITVE